MTILQVGKTIDEVLNLDMTTMDATDQNALMAELIAFAENTEYLAKKYSKDYDNIRVETLNFFQKLLDGTGGVGEDDNLSLKDS